MQIYSFAVKTLGQKNGHDMHCSVNYGVRLLKGLDCIFAM